MHIQGWWVDKSFSFAVSIALELGGGGGGGGGRGPPGIAGPIIKYIIYIKGNVGCLSKNYVTCINYTHSYSSHTICGQKA